MKQGWAELRGEVSGYNGARRDGVGAGNFGVGLGWERSSGEWKGMHGHNGSG